MSGAVDKSRVAVAVTAEEFRRAWAIRYESYVSFGHIEPQDIDKVRDWRDAVATVFLAYTPECSEPVGTLRCLIGPIEDFEGRAYIAPHVRPGERIGELTKLAVLPEYQKRTGRQSVLLHLIATLGPYLRQSDLDALYLVTIDENARVYERLGFRRVSGPVRFEGFPRDHFVLEMTRDAKVIADFERLAAWLAA